MNIRILVLGYSILIASFVIIQRPYASPTLNITVNTDKETYLLGEIIHFYGNLTLDGSPIPNNLVALQVNDPRNNMFIIRTLSTGTVPVQNWSVEIDQVIPCDAFGVPKNSFKRGTTAYFNISIKNNENETKYATITLNLYDSTHNTLMAFPPYQGSIPPGVIGIIISVPIPSYASTGEASLYVSAFTQEPRLGGVPWCPEKAGNFTITSSSSSALSTASAFNQMITPEATEGNYSFSCRIPSTDTWLGTYTAYVTSEYEGEQAFNSLTYEIILLGDVNKDGKVDAKDIAKVISGFGTAEGDPDWNPDYDVYPDGKIDTKDIAITIREYGKTGLYP